MGDLYRKKTKGEIGGRAVKEGRAKGIGQQAVAPGFNSTIAAFTALLLSAPAEATNAGECRCHLLRGWQRLHSAVTVATCTFVELV